MIVKPYVHGKHTARWFTEGKDEYIIYIEREDQIEELIEIKNYLSPFKKNLEQRAGNAEWFKLQQPQANYLPTFLGPKIIYSNTSLGNKFSINEGSLIDMTCFCIDSADLSLLAILNSSIIQFMIHFMCVEKKGGYYELKTQYMKNLPLPIPSSQEKKMLFELARQAIEKTRLEVNTMDEDFAINEIVCGLYELEKTEFVSICEHLNQ